MGLMSAPVTTAHDAELRADGNSGSRSPRRPHVLRRLVAIAVLVVVGVVVLGSAVIGMNIVTTAHSQDRTHTDALVVLGAAQFNGRPSPVLANRAAHALWLYRDGVSPRIITVGGNQPGDRYTEGGSAAAWLQEQGVAKAHVFAVPTGHDTLSSLTAVAQLAALHHWTSVTIVTDPAHAARSAQIARDLGLKVHTAPTQSGPGSALTLRYFGREFASTLHYLFTERSSVSPIGESR
jgi:uncharacterized SAM-binding protein YcdF (DUF218 family)